MSLLSEWSSMKIKAIANPGEDMEQKKLLYFASGKVQYRYCEIRGKYPKNPKKKLPYHYSYHSWEYDQRSVSWPTLGTDTCSSIFYGTSLAIHQQMNE